MKKIRRLQTQGEGPRMLALEPQMNLTHGLTPKRLQGILELADQGDILEQHLLFADMEDRCEHLAAEMGKRKRALLTLDWEILPGRANDARAARIAAAVREQFDAVNGFEDLLMDLADGIGHGFSACEIEWDYRYGLHLPAAFHFRPQSWFQVLREDRNQLRLRNGKPDGEELWPFGWIVHTLPVRLAAALRAVPHGGVGVFDPQLRAGGEHPLRAGPRPAVPAREVPARQSGGRSAGAVQRPADARAGCGGHHPARHGYLV